MVAHAEDEAPFDESSAVSYVLEYLDAPPTAKPSVRRLHEAVKVLFAQYKGVRPILYRLKRGTAQTEHVVRRANDLSSMVPEGWKLLRQAECAGKRVSFKDLHDNVHGVAPAQQLLAIRGMAAKHGIKL